MKEGNIYCSEERLGQTDLTFGLYMYVYMEDVYKWNEVGIYIYGGKEEKWLSGKEKEVQENW